jgi:hypothetical protein
MLGEISYSVAQKGKFEGLTVSLSERAAEGNVSVCRAEAVRVCHAKSQMSRSTEA